MDRRGFSLMEMMVAIAVLMVLTTLAVGVYRRHLANARKGEVYAMFGEIRVKEEAYREEYSSYYHSFSATAAQSETTYYPTTPTTSAQAWNPASNTGWYYLGMQGGGSRNSVYCGYNVLAGSANGTGYMGTNGQNWFATSAPTSIWWYANATCDNDGDTSTNATFTTSMDQTTVYEKNPTH